MNKILDAFFWRDPYTGKRRPRLVFWGVVLALVAVVIAAAATGLFVTHSPAALAPTPTFPPPTATPLPSPTFTPSPVPTATPVPVTEKDKLLAEIRGCEKDPSKWTLTDQHAWKWQVLSKPKCALEGLSRAVAWHIATRSMGYTADEAAQALGYPKGKWPWAPSRTWWTYFATAGKEGYAPLVIHFLPAGREWKTDNKGNLTGITLTPRGCYHANSVKGGRVKWWSEYGFPFTIECFFYEDFDSAYTVWQLPSGTVGDETDDPSRVSVLFAYSPETDWVYIGKIHDEKFAHPLSAIQTMPDYAAIQKRWQIPLWNLQWVEKAWGLKPKPLPHDWKPGMGKSEAFNAEWKSIVQDILQWVKEDGYYAVQKP